MISKIADGRDENNEHLQEEVLRYFCLLHPPDHLCHTSMDPLGELGRVGIFTVFKNGEC